MTDKLAEEIARKQISLYLKGRKDNPTNELFNRFIKAMQAYHESKLRESKIVESFEWENQYVTDEEIEAHFNTSPYNHIHPDRFRAEGAKAMRDGEIRHVSRDNE